VYLNILFGIASGIVTGLLPGIHVNTVVAIMLSRAITDPIGASIYILSLAITHSITEFIPTAFLGIPDSTTAEAQLPAHELAQQGRSFEALSISVLASLTGGLFSLLIAPGAFRILELLGLVFTRQMVVVTLALFILVPNLRSKRISVVIATAAAIALGFVSLQGDLLMPLLAGLFGVPHILEALRSKASAPIITSTRISRPAAVPLFASVPIGFLFSFLPGAGSSTA
jgi:putative membrane protein